MAQLDDRRDGFEKKFAHDEELRFKATARRNRILGAWAAAKLGHAGEESETYAKAVVMAAFQAGGDANVIRKIEDDLKAAGHAVSESEIRAKSDEFLTQAVAEIQTGT